MIRSAATALLACALTGQAQAQKVDWRELTKPYDANSTALKPKLEAEAPPPQTKSYAGPVKKDLLGFIIGMKEVDAMRLREICINDTSGRDCRPLEFTLTQSLAPNIVSTIKLKFLSGTEPAAIIDDLSTQYQSPPTKPDWSEEIARAKKPRMIDIRGTWFWAVGGTIAEWKLDADLTLRLALNRPGVEGRPHEYILDLIGAEPARRDAESIAQKARDRSKETSQTHPPPKL